MFISKCVLIIPTKDRSDLLKKTLKQFKKSKIKFKKILVIDSSEVKNLKKNKIFLKKNKIQHIISSPSTSKQRNIGLNMAMKIKGTKYIFLLDDDIIFEKKAFKEIDKIIKNYEGEKNIAGFGFNPRSKKKKNFFDQIKESKISENLGFYHHKQGKILDSGWQTKIKNIKKNLKTDWVSTAAIVLKISKIKGKKFNETFGCYSYLEDLDFSLQFRPDLFLIASKASFYHHKDIERTSFKFGFYEAVNRYKIVKKFKLNLISFLKMIIFKSILNLCNLFLGKINFFRRFLGNLYGIIYIVFSILFVR